jgi:tRNA dimethylallyltransferase
LQVARDLGDVEIVTVDSMQVYRGMDIGTAKPSGAERAEVAHHLLDLAEPSEEWSVKRWADAARAVIAEIEGRGRRPLLVGGTGLYFQAVVDGLAPPGRFPDVCAQLESEPDTSSLYRRLTYLDPVAASKIDPGNRRRILRALEVTIGTGRRFSSFGPGVAAYPATSWDIAGLWLPRPVVAARIEQRLAAMVRGGLVEETEALLRTPGALSDTARQALGYREMVSYLQGEVSLEQAVSDAAARTRAFSRRQRMWWRRDPRIRWYGAAGNPLAVVSQILGDWSER